MSSSKQRKRLRLARVAADHVRMMSSPEAFGEHLAAMGQMPHLHNAEKHGPLPLYLRAFVVSRDNREPAGVLDMPKGAMFWGKLAVHPSDVDALGIPPCFAKLHEMFRKD